MLERIIDKIIDTALSIIAIGAMCCAFIGMVLLCISPILIPLLIVIALVKYIF